MGASNSKIMKCSLNEPNKTFLSTMTAPASSFTCYWSLTKTYGMSQGTLHRPLIPQKKTTHSFNNKNSVFHRQQLNSLPLMEWSLMKRVFSEELFSVHQSQ